MATESSSFAEFTPPERDKPDLSAVEYFVDSFKSETDRQWTGISQLFGTTRTSRAEAAQAESDSGRNAQVLGRAAADLIPIAITAAGIRFGIGKRFTAGAEQLGAQARVSALSLHPMESGATGFLTSGLLKETDPSLAGDSKSLFEDRLESGIAGALSFGLVSAASKRLTAWGEQYGAQSVRAVLTRNPVVNGAATGVPAGLINTGVEAVHSGKPIEARDVKQSIVDMSLIGGVSALVGNIAARKAWHASAIREESEQGYVVSNIPDSKPPEVLSYRRYLRRTAEDPILEAKSPDEQWSARAEILSDAIAKRINDRQPKVNDFWSALASYSPEDQPIAKALLERSAGNATDQALLASLKSVGIQATNPPHTYVSKIIAESPGTSSSMLAYLLRKTQNSGQEVKFVGETISETIYSKGGISIMFVDLPNLSERAGAQILSEIKHRDTVNLIETNFDRLPNVIDFALGPDKVKAKLDKVVTETRRELAYDPSQRVEQAVDKVLQSPVDEAFAQLIKKAGPDAEKLHLLRPVPLPVEQAFQPRADAAKVQNYLNENFSDPRTRIAAAEVLAEDADYYSFGDVIHRLQELRVSIEFSARAKGLNPANDAFMVAPLGGASSEGYMAYMYSRANDIAPDRVQTMRQLSELPAPALRQKRLVMIDDSIYSGDQMTHALSNLTLPRRQFLFSGKRQEVATAVLSAYDGFTRNFPGSFGKNFDLITLQTDLATNTNLRSSFGNAEDSGAFGELFMDQGYKGITSFKVYPHMTPDSAPRWLREFAQKTIYSPS